MNTTQNKASLWKSCVEQGIFDKVPSGMQHQVQGLFELTINQFNNEGLDPALANQLVLKEFKMQLGKMIGQPIPQKTYDELNEEYRGQYQVKMPDKIEFSKEKDTPIEDMDLILKTKAEQRQNEIHEYFKEDQKIGGVLDKVPEQGSLFQSQTQSQTPFPVIGQPQIQESGSYASRDELKLHRRILESILNSQIKIIELLQRK
jgi:hypothetical protein